MLKNARIDAMGAYAYHDDALAVIDNIASNTAFVFAQDDPRFDRARFLKACGVES
jgi:hypothetical protein